jgi:hypothetical protein
MAVLIIPTFNDGSGFYEQTTNIEGVDYVLTFQFNARDGFWYLSLRTSAGVSIAGCESLRLVNRGQPLRRVVDQERPPGELYVYSSNETYEPGLYDLGVNTLLTYIPKSDLDELENG